MQQTNGDTAPVTAREIVTTDGKAFHFRDYDLATLEPGEVRVRVNFAAPKHGTEARLFSGSVFAHKQWDGHLRMFVPRETSPGEVAAPAAERGIGNMIVGTVVAAGPSVTRLSVGDGVYGYGSIRELAQGPEDRFQLLRGLSAEAAVCTDPAHVALVAVRDGNIRIGDDVAVFGLGAIGLLTVQIARAGGARRVFAIDPVALRRAQAGSYDGVTALDPSAVDAALEIKRATEDNGVDVAIETSGNGRALHEAIRCIRQCGTVVHVPWGPKDATHLRLDEEFHHNRPTIIGSQAVWDNPDRSHPLWNEARARQVAAELLRDGTISGSGIVTPVVPFEDAPAALAELFLAPEKAIKIGVSLP